MFYDGTDHVITRPMKGLGKTAPNVAHTHTHTQTSQHGNYMTKLGPVGEKYKDSIHVYIYNNNKTLMKKTITCYF